MPRLFLVMATGALLSLAATYAAPNASAHERCVCTSSIPVPPVAPVAPVPPVPPIPPAAGHRVHKEVIIINPDGHGMHRTRHVVRVVERSEGRMTRDEFVHRAERAFDEHDKNHDGVLGNEERDDMDSDGMGDVDEDNDEIEIPEPPEAMEPPEPPEAPAPPAPPRRHH